MKKLRIGFIGAGGICRTNMRYLATFSDVAMIGVHVMEMARFVMGGPTPCYSVST